MWRIFLLNTHTHTHKVAQRKIQRDRSESVWVQRAQREKTRIHSDTTVPLGLEHKVHTLEENVSQCVCTNEKTKRGRKMCVSATVCVCVCTPAGCTLITCITEAHTEINWQTLVQARVHVMSQITPYIHPSNRYTAFICIVYVRPSIARSRIILWGGDENMEVKSKTGKPQNQHEYGKEMFWGHSWTLCISNSLITRVWLPFSWWCW